MPAEHAVMAKTGCAVIAFAGLRVRARVVVVLAAYFVRILILSALHAREG